MKTNDNKLDDKNCKEYHGLLQKTLIFSLIKKKFLNGTPVYSLYYKDTVLFLIYVYLFGKFLVLPIYLKT